MKYCFDCDKVTSDDNERCPTCGNTRLILAVRPEMVMGKKSDIDTFLFDYLAQNPKLIGDS